MDLKKVAADQKPYDSDSERNTTRVHHTTRGRAFFRSNPYTPAPASTTPHPTNAHRPKPKPSPLTPLTAPSLTCQSPHPPQ